MTAIRELAKEVRVELGIAATDRRTYLKTEHTLQEIYEKILPERKRAR